MIKPLPGYVLVEPIEEEEISAGGIYTPESTKDKPSRGKVVEMSNWMFLPNGDSLMLGVMAQSIETLSEIYGRVKKGSVVVYKKWTNQEVQHEGKEYLLVKFDELLAIIE